jgi:hypothetical protein
VSEDYADETLKTIVSWGGCAELFAYDEQSELFTGKPALTGLNRHSGATRRVELRCAIAHRRISGRQSGDSGFALTRAPE